MVYFAHLADVHIGAWRDQRLSDLADEAFEMAIDRCISEEVDFVVIAGDLFHSALPGIDRLRHVVRCLERLKQAGIRVYCIPGSHDYSPSGKTMLSVLSEADLLVNVYRESESEGVISLEPVVDEKTGVSLVGLLGRAGQLDTQKYQKLDVASLQQLSSPKIFVFHAALSDLVSSRISGANAASVSLLPSGFNYYAGGHVHIIKDVSVKGYNQVVYPGPTFPASFSELELLGGGSFCLVKDWQLQRVSLNPRSVEVVVLDCDGKSPSQVSDELREQVESLGVSGAVVLVRARGVLVSGSSSDIAFSEVFSSALARGAYACLKNTFGVSSPELEVSSSASSSMNASEIEESVLSEYADSKHLSGVSDQKRFMKDLLQVLSQVQAEGETKASYERRIVSDAHKLLSDDKE